MLIQKFQTRQISSEIVNSYEIELDNKLIPLKPINNIYGHSIEQWKIHGNKFIYPLKTNNTGIIEENDILAIEIYVSIENYYYG